MAVLHASNSSKGLIAYIGSSEVLATDDLQVKDALKLFLNKVP